MPLSIVSFRICFSSIVYYLIQYKKIRSMITMEMNDDVIVVAAANKYVCVHLSR